MMLHGMIDEMDVVVRQMGAADRTVWADMRTSLWPDDTPQQHAAEIDQLLEDGEAWSFMAETSAGQAAAFAEIAIRKYANGCDGRPVAFLEGIWVSEDFRRRGVGARLVSHIEAFLAARGFHELGSDTPLDNDVSQSVHLGWGFSETERVVYFRKLLRSPAR
jgi:aminoglycoside 6'-N-acetyltransferase I